MLSDPSDDLNDLPGTQGEEHQEGKVAGLNRHGLSKQAVREAGLKEGSSQNLTVWVWEVTIIVAARGQPTSAESVHSVKT